MPGYRWVRRRHRPGTHALTKEQKPAVKRHRLTVGEVIQRVFPNGTDEANGITPVPEFPPDLFAVAVHLLDLGGAYHNVIPAGGSDWPTCAVRPDAADLISWSDSGANWRGIYPGTPAAVTSIWADLVREADTPVFREPRLNGDPPGWWILAYALMVMADEACARVGYLHEEDRGDGADVNWIAVAVTVILGRVNKASPAGHIRLNQQVASICRRADRDVVCVQPKAHTSDVGCTTRSLTRNLAYLPPRGRMRAHWQRSPTTLQPDLGTPLRVLMIPFPFHVEPTWFKAESVPADHVTGRPHNWGWFRVDQGWLPIHPAEMVGFTSALIREATSTTGPIGAVVFPEYSLNWETYSAIVDDLRDNHPDVDILVGGSSDNCVGERGNYALSSHFFVGPDGDRIVSTTSRAKHHRWRLDKSQIAAYGLGGSLDPNLHWWEAIPLPQRELNVNVFRRASVLTTMICEDLARSEPAHDVLRALGPNLVFVLLMDSVQIPARWPARYATGLTEDPGSSVLTFTSRALIQRANALRGMPADESWAVALWRDPGNASPYVVDCGPAYHGVVLTLQGVVMEKATLDGRHDTDAVSWNRTGDPVPVTLPAAEVARLPWLRGNP